MYTSGFNNKNSFLAINKDNCTHLFLCTINLVAFNFITARQDLKSDSGE